MDTQEINKRTLVLIDWLMMGGRVEIDEYTYVLDAEYALCAVGYNQDGDERTMRVLGYTGLSLYRRLAQDLTEDDYSATLANIGLNKI